MRPMTVVSIFLHVIALWVVVAPSPSTAVRRRDRRAERSARAACAKAHAADESDDALLQCISPECRDLVYADDPLEEGEFDRERRARFEACVRENAREKQRRRRGRASGATQQERGPGGIPGENRDEL